MVYMISIFFALSFTNLPERLVFTITTEIHARSLANFYLNNSLHLAQKYINNSLHLARKYINNSLHLARKCPRTLSVPSSEQFSESVARGKL